MVKHAVPRISVLIVTWNSAPLLEACFSHLRAQQAKPDEVIVVDNASADGTREWLRQQPDVTFIGNALNVGFAAANNQGLRACTGDFVLLLNADVELGVDYIARCLPHFEKPDVGSVTGKLLRATPQNMIDSTGHTVFGLGWTENRGELQSDLGYNEPGEVFGVCAAAALYRRVALDSARVDDEYMDETYFSYIEDVDLDWRLRWMGWRAWYEPAAGAVHHRHASGARRSPPIMRHILKNRILTVVKNYDARSLVTNLPGLALFTTIKTVDFGLAHPSSVLGLVDAARLLPLALRRRRQIRARRRVDPDVVRPWLRPFPWRDRVRRRLARIT